jgi:hypothetical protein
MSRNIFRRCTACLEVRGQHFGTELRNKESSAKEKQTLKFPAAADFLHNKLP